MATRTKTKKTRPARNLSSEGLTLDDYVVDLPDAPNKPSDDVKDYFIVFFGEKSVGKTTLLNQFPGALIWQLEPGRKNAAVMQQAIDFETVDQMEAVIEKHGLRREEYATPWKKLCKQVAHALDQDRYQVLSFDTLDRLYHLVVEDYCFMNEVADINKMNDFGASHKRTDQVIEQFLVGVKRVKGILGTSHGKTREIASDRGDMIEVKAMTAAPRMENILRAVSDMQVYYGYTEDGNRLFYVREKHFVKASCGIDGRFLFKGKQVASFAAGNSATEAYKNFNLAFANKKKPIEYVGDAPSSEDSD